MCLLILMDRKQMKLLNVIVWLEMRAFSKLKAVLPQVGATSFKCPRQPRAYSTQKEKKVKVRLVFNPTATSQQFSTFTRVGIACA